MNQNFCYYGNFLLTVFVFCLFSGCVSSSDWIAQSDTPSVYNVPPSDLEVSNIKFTPEHLTYSNGYRANRVTELSFTVTNRGVSSLKDYLVTYYARMYDKNGNYLDKSIDHASLSSLEPGESREMIVSFYSNPYSDAPKDYGSLPIGRIEIVEVRMNYNGNNERVITYNY